MKKRAICLIAAVLTSVSLLSGCAFEKADRGDKLSIVTTSFPPYDFVRAVAGEEADIDMLLQAGAEAHSYEPVPLDIAKIQNCDVFVYIGGEGEVWVDKILDSIDTEGKTIIRLFDYIDPLEEEEVEGASPDGHHHHHHDDEDDEEDEHDHDEDDHDDEEDEEFDEHIWTSPRNAELCVQGIEAALCRDFPEKRETFSRQGEAYEKQLEQLDRDFEEMTKISKGNTIVVGDRFPFRYLAHDYGLKYYAAFSGCSSESEPSVYTMAFLIDKLLEGDTDVVFYLEFSTKRLAEKLSEAAGVEMLPLQSCHNVTREDFRSGVTYISLMKQNLENLREALN